MTEAENMAVVNQAPIPWAKLPGRAAIRFREANMPRVNFYPNNDAWSVLGTTKVFRGDAVAFFRWYLSKGFRAIQGPTVFGNEIGKAPE